ncbi:MAG: hypothetical protein ACLUGP_12850 [Faecalibacterium prausnitzii]
MVYEYAPADPNPGSRPRNSPPPPLPPLRQRPRRPLRTTPLRLAPTTPTAPAADPPAEGGAEKPTKNVIRVINNWVGETAKELKIRLSNVNIKVEDNVDKAAMDVSGGGKTKVELDGQNALDGSRSWYQAGLRKQERER